MSTITFQCFSCNQVLRVGADKAGRKAKCIKCGTILTIPAADQANGPLAADSQTGVTAGPPAPKGPAAPPPLPAAADDDDEDDDEDLVRKKRRREEDEEDEEEDRPRKKRRRDEQDDDDDDEDRPRRKRRRADDDEDEEDDDLPRKKRRRDQDDEDDDEDEDDRKTRKRNRDRRQQLRVLGTGLMLYFGKYLVLGSTWGLLALGFMFNMIGILAQTQALTRVGDLMAGFGVILFGLVVPIPGIVGGSLCLKVPAKSGAWGLALTSLILDSVLIALIILFFVNVGLSFSNPFNIPGALGGVLIIMVLYGFTLLGCFIINMIMLSLTASYLKDGSSASAAITNMILYLAVGIGGAVVLVVIGMLVAPRPNPAQLAVGMAVQQRSVGSQVVLMISLLAYLIAMTVITVRIAFLCKDIKANT